MKIGIFDSGIGGLSVLYEAMQLLPHREIQIQQHSEKLNINTK